MSTATVPLAAADVARTVLSEFVDGVVATLPRLVAGVVFLTMAYVGIRLVRSAARSVLRRVYPPDQDLVVDLFVTAITLFLWFGAGLALLKIVGMDDVAASLGTATGFIGLGIAFALKEMIADTVAGVYLLKDPDFNEGDFVTAASVTGIIVDVGLRKTRIREEGGDLVVVANRDVEKKWTRQEPDTGDPDA